MLSHGCIAERRASLRRLTIIVFSFLSMCLQSSSITIAAPGDLDPSFDGDGRRILNVSGVDLAQAVRIQADGKIVVAGYTNVFGANDYQIVRLNPNGSLDATFDGDGRSILNFSGVNFATAMTLQANGKIVVAGYTNVFGANDYQIVRLNPNGSLDATFDGDGRRILNFSGVDFATAMTLQADGKIVVAGYTNVFGVNDYQIVRLLGP
jgi:uncharacterized delta-60 repeat protein